MIEENIVEQEDIETPEEDIREDVDEEEEETPEEEDTDEKDEEIEALKAKNKKLYARLKRDGIDPETGDVVKKKVVPAKVVATETNDSKVLSNSDLLALLDAKLSDEGDVDQVIADAKLLGVTVKEALENKIVVEKLRVASEQRTTADATNTKSTRAGAKKTTDKQLLNDASKGEVPEVDSAEAEQLFWARRGGKPE